MNAASTDQPVNLATNFNPAYWTLDNGFYWTDPGDGSPGAGSVNYVAQQASQLDSLQYSSSAAEASLYKCAALSALYTALARTVLESEGQHVQATGVKIDDFYRVNNSSDPCGAGGGTSDWSGSSTRQNPVQNNVTYSSIKKVTASTDLESLVQQGPVLLEGSKSVRWMLATANVTVTHGTEQVAGVSMYDPLSGSRVLFQYDVGQGQYKPALILDPRKNVWCAWTGECPNLVKNIRTTTARFTLYELGVIQDFVPRHYMTAVVRP